VRPVSVETARRFVLGRQGLWPGRRWEGRTAVDRALRYIGSVQPDPLDVVGHSQDLALWGRIVGYRAADLQAALYRRRTLFEWGGNLQIRPVEELPYLRIVMQRKVLEERWRRFARAHASLLARVTREVEVRGPLGSREFTGPGEVRIHNYRAGKEVGLALYYLWLKGELMVASRRRGEKVFDLTSRLFPRLSREVPRAEAEEHSILQTLRHLGLASRSEWLNYGHTRLGRTIRHGEWTEWTHRLLLQGDVQEVEVDGWKERQWLTTDGAPDLETLRSSGVPAAWKPRSTMTDEEVIFLAPLETVSARGRATRLFDFEYVWEVYKPASARRWGYYTLPVLFRDGLCARIELRYDRTKGVLRVIGFWPEEPSLRRDPNFVGALGRALGRLADFHRATEVDPTGLHSPAMQRRVVIAVRQARDVDLVTEVA
jgi:uncharacterized protein